MPVNICGSTFLESLDDEYLNETGDIMKGNLDLGGNKIINVQEPKNPNDVVNKEYLEKFFVKKQDMFTMYNECVKQENRIKDYYNFKEMMDPIHWINTIFIKELIGLNLDNPKIKKKIPQFSEYFYFDNNTSCTFEVNSKKYTFFIILDMQPYLKTNQVWFYQININNKKIRQREFIESTVKSQKFAIENIIDFDNITKNIRIGHLNMKFNQLKNPFNLYEFMCFNRVLNDYEESKVYKFFMKYYKNRYKLKKLL